MDVSKVCDQIILILSEGDHRVSIVFTMLVSIMFLLQLADKASGCAFDGFLVSNCFLQLMRSTPLPSRFDSCENPPQRSGVRSVCFTPRL